jgi:hypothetical protein
MENGIVGSESISSPKCTEEHDFTAQFRQKMTIDGYCK